MTNAQKRKQLLGVFGAYSKRLEGLYDDFITKLSRLAIKSHVSVKDMLSESPLYHFDDYPELKQELNGIFADYFQTSMLNYRAGITDGVALAYTQNNAVLSGFSILSDEALRSARKNAANAFIRSRLKTTVGLNLSQMVWNYCSQTKSEFEVAVSNVLADGLKKGTSAIDLAREVRQYLNNPDMMYRRYHRTVVDAQGNKKDIVRWRRRVIDENGKVRFVEEPLEKVGMGHYRSSAKNAQRLMRTEINMAYHHANAERWQKEPFVIGIIIDLSPEHPEYDMCDELQGRYPKDFVFIGWHPQCLCMANPITIQGEEKKEFYRRLAAGEDMSNYVSPYAVKEIPDKAKKWIEDNHDKFVGAGERGKLGYVWRENQKYLRPFFSQEEQQKMGIMAQRMKRVKTDAEKADIQRRWDERKAKNALIEKTASNVLNVARGYREVDLSALSQAINVRNYAKIQSATKDVARQLATVKRQYNALTDLMPNINQLRQTYSLVELQEAHAEFDGVMKKWLAKYNYPSLDKAPLEHLKNKLTFELSSPTISYVQKDIINKAITEQIKLVDYKIEWETLVKKADALKGFVTKSSIFKDCIAEIELAIQRNDMVALKDSIAKAEKKQQKLLKKKFKRDENTTTALNAEYKGGVVGQDITPTVDVAQMTSEDPYRHRFTNNVARMQGFDAPAKLVTPEEFAILEQQSGDVFYRTVNDTLFKGQSMSSKEFASQLYKADLLELNGPGGRAYGDGMYVASSAWDGRKINQLSESLKKGARAESRSYGNSRCTVSEMTWTRKPNIIRQDDLENIFNKLPRSEKAKFDFHPNTYGVALGYDAMYCDGPNYIVVWNRSIIAVKRQ